MSQQHNITRVQYYCPMDTFSGVTRYPYTHIKKSTRYAKENQREEK